MKKFLTTKLLVVFSLLSVCSQGAYSADESNQSIQSSGQKEEKSSWWPFWKKDWATPGSNKDGQSCRRGDGKRKMSADNQTEEKGSRRGKGRRRGRRGHRKGEAKGGRRRGKGKASSAVEPQKEEIKENKE